MSIPARTMFRGDSLRFAVTVTREGAPVDLTGGKMWMTAKRSPADADALAVFQVSSPADGIVITHADAGLAEITIPPAATNSLTAVTRLVYDIQLLEAVGLVTTLETGYLTVNVDVTRAGS